MPSILSPTRFLFHCSPNPKDDVTFANYTTENGLAHNTVLSMREDREGNIWLSTLAGGVSRYDGQQFTTFTTADGLGNNKILHVLEDCQSILWFAAYGGGVTRYDGTAFQTLLQRDGLAHDASQQVLQDRRGDIWIASEGGLTRYRPRRDTLPVRITGVTADQKYGPVAELTLSSAQNYLTFEFSGTSFRTRPGQLLYQCRLEEYEAEWRQTREQRMVYTGLPAGEYLFQVRAVDRDLNYSAPAVVKVHVRLPYERLLWNRSGKVV